MTDLDSRSDTLCSKTLDLLEKEAFRAGDPQDDLGMDKYWRERYLDLISALRESREETEANKAVCTAEMRRGAKLEREISHLRRVIEWTIQNITASRFKRLTKLIEALAWKPEGKTDEA